MCANRMGLTLKLKGEGNPPLILRLRYKLPKKFTKRWQKALRSGKYTQGTEELYDIEQDSYCCLGVAAKLCGIPKVDMAGIGRYIDLREGYQHKLPAELVEELYPYRLVTELILMNDSGDYTFEEIADWIKENVELI